MRKMYQFNPNDYGQSWIILATSKIEALNFLKTYLISNAIMKDHSYWKKATVSELPMKYTIDEHGYGDVVQYKIS